MSDLQGSTALAERLDPESLRSVLDQYFDELGAVLSSYGGRVEKRIGDAMVTVFGLPEPRPDDACRAVRAAAESQRTLAELNVRLEAGWGVTLTNRTAVASGAVVYASAGGGHRVLAGDALTTASGLEPLAPPLGVLVSAGAAVLLGDHATLGPPEQLQLAEGSVIARRLLTIDAGELAPAVDGGGCTVCGASGADVVDWCVACGAPRTTRPRRHESRRTLTIVFVDLAVRQLGGAADPSAARAAVLQAFGVVRSALDDHGGTVENFIGDAVMAVFGLDQRHEDDALRAVRAALDVHDRLASIAPGLASAHSVEVVARIGVNTGPVIAGDPTAGERLVTGDAVNVAARLEQTAAPGEVVIGELTLQLAGPSVSHEPVPPLVLKGKAEPVRAFRVSDVRSPSTRVRRFELPLLGRDTELAAMRTAFEHVAHELTWQRLRLRGDAGIGKSRLVHELLDDIADDTEVLRGACLPYGEGITFWPLAEIVRSAAGFGTGIEVDEARRALSTVTTDPEVVARLLSLIGLDDVAVPVPELLWAIRSLLSSLARRRPLVVVIDGLQWAEPTLVGLLDDLVGHPGPGAVLLITMERGDHADVAAPAPDAGEHVVVVDVAALDDDTCDRLITGALGEDVLPADVRRDIVGASAGVPLFIEQLLTMLIDDGRLVEVAGTWHAAAEIGELTVPPTIEALLAARIDALPEDEALLIRPASVIGREFPVAAIGAMATVAVGEATLSSLDRRQLVSPLGSPSPMADHRFRNLLIRDVVYDGLLKRTRAAMHEQYAGWLLTGPASVRLTEVEEIVGSHLERAFLLGREVAAVDTGLVEVGRRAATHLGAAGERAFARGDMPAAANLLQRAARALHDGGSAAARLLVLAGDARFETGAFADAVALYQDAQHLAIEAGDPSRVAAAELAETTLGYLTGDGVDDARARSTADRLEPIFEAGDDHAGTARCWRLRTYVDMFHCRWGEAERSAARTIHHAGLAGDVVLEHRVMPALAGFALYGPTPVPRAMQRCDDLLTSAGSDRRSRALVEQFLAHLLALDGRFDEARALCLEARTGLQELGWNFDAALVSIHLGPIELMAGDADAAERELRADYETLQAMGERNYLSTTAYLLAEAVRRQGRDDESIELTAEAEAIAADDDVFSQIGWRSVRTRVLARRGEHPLARRLAEETVDLARSTDGPNAQGEAFIDLADVLARTGEIDHARRAVAEAVDLFAAKQSRVAHARATKVVADLS